MAVAYDASSSVAANLVSSVTLSHTCTGSNGLLTVGVMLQRNAAAVVSTVSGITYNGVAMTRAIRESTYAVSISTEIWYLKAPTTGANNIVVTLNNALTNDIVVGGISLTGVDQTSPLDATATAAGFTNAPSATITTVADNAWIIDNFYTYLSPTVGAGQTQRYNLLANGNSYGAGSTRGPKTPAGSQANTWTIGATAADWSMAVAAFKPVAVAALSSPTLLMMGV